MENIDFLKSYKEEKAAKRRLLSRRTGVLVAILAVLLLGGGYWALTGNDRAPGRVLGDADYGSAWLDSEAIKRLNTGGWTEIGSISYQLPDNPRPRGLNIVFVSDGFASREEFQQTTEGIISSMKTVEPWKSYEEFNFFPVFNPDSALCEVKDDTGFTPRLTCPKEFLAVFEPLPLARAKIVVVSRRNFVAWANVTRLENSFVFYSLPQNKEQDLFHQKILLHEFAHGFGLRDETRSIIGIAGSAPARPEGPNCAANLNVADALWGEFVKRTEEGARVFDRTQNEVGFYFGCAGNDDYLRPTQQSLMNIQDFPGAEDYGPVSEDYLRKVLKYCFSEKIYRYEDDEVFFELYPEFKECL